MKVAELRKTKLFKDVLSVIGEGKQALMEEAFASGNKEVSWALLNQAKGCAMAMQTVERFLSSLEGLEEEDNGN